MKFIELEGNTGFQQAIRASEALTKLIVIGAPDDATLLNDAMSLTYNAKDTLQEARNLNPEHWLSAKQTELVQTLEEQGGTLEELTGEWPGASEAQHNFALGCDVLTQEPLHKLTAIEVPCEFSWQVPAHLNFGGWNHCPGPADHCALWRYWQDKYDARIVGMSGDVIEAYVANPPSTQEEAMTLAWQHYFYCPDLVEQGVEGIAHLAAALLRQKVWFFWWD